MSTFYIQTTKSYIFAVINNDPRTTLALPFGTCLAKFIIGQLLLQKVCICCLDVAHFSTIVTVVLV